MTDLSTIRDVEALENRYLGKVIVYVESEDDEEAYRRFAGPDVADRLEFKTPKLGGSGWEAVRDRVKEERPSNDNVWGLVDGEAVVHFANWSHLVACDRTLFQVTTADSDGLIFIHSHELENILLLYGDICALIVKSVKLGDLTKHKLSDVQTVLETSARRFFVSAAMKYAAGNLERVGTNTVLFKVGKFLQVPEKSTIALFLELRAEVKALGCDWAVLRDEIRAVMSALRKRFADEVMDANAQVQNFVRLADGKGLLNRLKQIYNSSGPLDGHLVDAVSKTAYAAQFKAELLQLTS